jgi:hypothetical protein
MVLSDLSDVGFAFSLAEERIIQPINSWLTVPNLTTHLGVQSVVLFFQKWKISLYLPHLDGLGEYRYRNEHPPKHHYS